MEKHLIEEFIMKAPINKIISFSNVDGPGNRCSIFFQGCPFSCLYCHNPETINECSNCGKCVSTCPTHALTFVDGVVRYDASVCINCDTCIKVCDHLSSPKIQWLSVEELVDKIKAIRPFIRGITVSGGECMLHADYLLALFKQVKALGLTCLIDSNGGIDFEKHQELLEISDGVMLDVKAVSPIFHQRIIHADNAVVLKNLNYLLHTHKLEEVRTVILPNQDEENRRSVEAISKLIKNQCRYKLLKYRYYGVRNAGIELFGQCIVEDEVLLHYQELCIANGCETSVIV